MYLRTLIVVMLGGLFCLSTSALADQSVAKDAFTKGGELVDAGNYEEAAKQYRLAYEHNPTWKLLYNIGQCEAGAKRYGLALESFEQYLVQAGDDISLARREEVETETERLRTLVGLLNVTGPAGTKVIIDGYDRGQLPITSLIPVSAAVAHEVVGVLDGQERFSETITLRGKQEYKVVMAGEVTESTGRHDDAVDATTDLIASGQGAASIRTPAIKKWGIGLLAGGGALLAGGVAMGASGLLKARSIDSDNPNGLTTAQQSKMDDLKRLVIVGDVMMGVGGVAIITSIVLLVANKRKTETLSARLTPTIGPVTGLYLTGSF